MKTKPIKQVRAVSSTPAMNLSDLRRLAERLRNDVVRVLSAIPEPSRGVTRLSKWTGVPKPLCFRVMAAAKPHPEPLNVIEVLPGVDGLASTVNAIAAHCSSRAVRTSALRCVKTYTELLDHLGGTQARARRAVASLVRDPSESEVGEINHRKAAFDSARGIAGVWSDALVIVQCIRPSRIDPARLEGTVISGHVGLRAGHAHLPVTFTWQNRERVSDGLRSIESDRQHGLNHYALLSEFSSNPFPKVITDGEAGFERDVIDWDAEPIGARGPLDIFLGIRMSDARVDGGYEAHAITRVPTRRLYMDILLPLDMNIGGPVYGGAYFVGFGGPVRGDPSARWHDRLHDLTPAYDSLTTSGSLEDQAFVRHNELLEYTLQHTELKRAQCRHVRWMIRYPIWGCDYSFRVTATGIHPIAQPTTSVAASPRKANTHSAAGL